MVGLHCFAGCSLVVSSRACSLVVEHELLIVRTLLIARTSLVADHRLSCHGTQASLPCGMWDLLQTGDQTCVSYTAGRFFTTEPNWGNPTFMFFLPPWGSIVLRPSNTASQHPVPQLSSLSWEPALFTPGSARWPVGTMRAYMQKAHINICLWGTSDTHKLSSLACHWVEK